MADVKLNTLPQSTSPTSTQDLLLFDESTNAGQRINYNTLADVILAKLTSKTYTVGGGTQTLISAIDALNSNPYTTLHRYPATGWSETADLVTEIQRYWTSFPNIKLYACVLALNNVGEVSLLVYRNGNYGTVIANCFAWGESVVLKNMNGTWSKYDVQAEINTLNSNLSSLYCRDYSYESGTSYKAAVTDVISKLGNTIARYWVIITIGASRLSLMIVKDGVQWSSGILTSYGSTTTDVYFVMSRADSSSNTVVYLRKLLTGDLE